EANDIPLAVPSRHDPQLAYSQVSVNLPVRHCGPWDTSCDAVERLSQFALLVDCPVRCPGRSKTADELVVVLEWSARRRLQFDSLVDLAVGDSPGDGQRLDRMERRPSRVHLPLALIERHDQVMQIIRWWSQFLAWQVAHFEGEESMRRDGSEEPR